MLNREYYANGIGDKYYLRRKPKMDLFKENYTNDPIYIAVKALGLAGKYLEVGCSNGWRLEVLDDLGLDCYGIDPSIEAVLNAPEGRVWHGTADKLPFDSNSYDIVSFGFSLYTTDNADLFKIAYESDRVSKEYIIIYDFIVDGYVYKPNPDCPAITTCKMDYSKMFAWNPLYSHIYMRRHKNPFDNGVEEVVSVFKKPK